MIKDQICEDDISKQQYWYDIEIKMPKIRIEKKIELRQTDSSLSSSPLNTKLDSERDSQCCSNNGTG